MNKNRLFENDNYKNQNIDHASLSDKKLKYEFAKEMHFDIRGPGIKSTRDRTLIKILRSPATLASGISTIFLPSDAEKLYEIIITREESQK